MTAWNKSQSPDHRARSRHGPSRSFERYRELAPIEKTSRVILSRHYPGEPREVLLSLPRVRFAERNP